MVSAEEVGTCYVDWRLSPHSVRSCVQGRGHLKKRYFTSAAAPRMSTAMTKVQIATMPQVIGQPSGICIGPVCADARPAIASGIATAPNSAARADLARRSFIVRSTITVELVNASRALLTGSSRQAAARLRLHADVKRTDRSGAPDR